MKSRRYFFDRMFVGKVVFSVILIAVLLIYVFFENKIKLELDDIVRLKAEELCTNSVNTAVLSVIEEGGYKYGDFAEISANSNLVTNIGINSVSANKFKSQVALKAQENINDMCGMDISYKIGDFFDSALFMGRGFDIVIQLYFSSSVDADIESEFESCGVNQTKHTINVVVTSKVYITSDGDVCDTYTTVKTTVPVAENIIVGNTPSMYFSKQ